MPKKQKVKFHRGDKRPGTHQFTLSYTKKNDKEKKKYILASDRETN